MPDDLIDDECRSVIRLVADKAVIARASGNMDALRRCVIFHGVFCDSAECEASYAAPTVTA